MIRAGIFGVSGYAGQKLVEIILRHPEVRITYALVSPEEGTPSVAEIIPRVEKLINLKCHNQPDWKKIAQDTDLIFLALPHIISMKFVPEIVRLKKKVIDLSADFRFKNPDVYQTYYTRHTCPELLQKAVYGLPELNRDKIKKADLIANPGCYPTSLLLALLPLAKNHLIEDRIIVDSKSGVTGAGRSLTPGSLFVECNENIKAYKIGEHRHAPEMAEILGAVGKANFQVIFVPHLIPLNQGILSTIYVNLKQTQSFNELEELYQQFYKKEPFVRIMKYGQSPATKNVVDTNFCDLGFKLIDKRTLVLISAIDNLVKGASGQAVQNMNIMYDLPETIPFYGK